MCNRTLQAVSNTTTDQKTLCKGLARDAIVSPMIMNPLSWYVALMAIGLLLIIAEVFIPGGVAGVIGGLALLAAMGLGLFSFPPPWGFLSAISIVLMGGVGLLLWVQLFPRTRTGRRITLQADSAAYKSVTAPSSLLIGSTGETVTPLRPAGIALVAGKRYDVLADGGEWIAAGTIIRVSAIRDANLLVCEEKNLT